ncbi:hypothetical protein [Vreelandella utahensis]|uniref:hypothetical protein n=1 Tax=Vreelandella halophila TaxID=86177 RepID=UPI000987835C|nr:hypothetical protein [Halomonas utahensis]
MPKHQHHLVAPLPEPQYQRAHQVISDIRTNGVTKERRDDLYNLIMELTETGTDFFFLEPLRRMNAGAMLQKMAKMGISSMLKGTRMVIHNVLKKADDEHIEGILVFLEEVLFEPESDA